MTSPIKFLEKFLERAVPLFLLTTYVALICGLIFSEKFSKTSPWSSSLYAATHNAAWGTLTVMFTYCALLIIMRWHYIARPIQANAQSELSALKDQLELKISERGTVSPNSIQVTTGKLMETHINEVKTLLAPPTFSEFLYWSGSRELQAWRQIHYVKLLDLSLIDDSEVCAELDALTGQLTLELPREKNYLDIIRSSCSPSTVNTGEYRKVMLRNIREYLYNRQDDGFAALAEANSKSIWMLIASTLGVCLCAAVGGVPLLIAGAMGGLVSRLSRLALAQVLPTDYGSSWPTLYLSPIAGALAAWGGLLLIDLAKSLKLLGSVLDCVSWAAQETINAQPAVSVLLAAIVKSLEIPAPVVCSSFTVLGVKYTAAALGAALLFGFSERLFVGLAARVDDSVLKHASGSPSS